MSAEQRRDPKELAIETLLQVLDAAGIRGCPAVKQNDPYICVFGIDDLNYSSNDDAWIITMYFKPAAAALANLIKTQGNGVIHCLGVNGAYDALWQKQVFKLWASSREQDAQFGVLYRPQDWSEM